VYKKRNRCLLPLSPVLKANALRVVLTWASAVLDADVHLNFRSSAGLCQVGYFNRLCQQASCDRTSSDPDDTAVTVTSSSSSSSSSSTSITTTTTTSSGTITTTTSTSSGSGSAAPDDDDDDEDLRHETISISELKATLYHVLVNKYSRGSLNLAASGVRIDVYLGGWDYPVAQLAAPTLLENSAPWWNAFCLDFTRGYQGIVPLNTFAATHPNLVTVCKQ